jgi:hypothetical protein
MGTNVASLTGDSTELNNKSPRIGLYAGITWDIFINQVTYLQVGVIYSQQGVKFYSDYFYQGLYNKDEIIHKINYLQFPVVVKQLWGNIYTEFGGYLAFIPFTPKSTWIKEVDYPDSVHTISGSYLSFANSLKIYDIGGIIGLGYQTPVTPQIDGYINFSFKPGFILLNRPDARPEYKMRNQVFTVNLGLIFIGKAARHNSYYFLK